MYEILKEKNVLYIEDDEVVLENIGTTLGNFFKTFYTAQSGEKGYEVFLEKEIDLILVDIELPHINGIELIKKIRLTNLTIPIIIISAYTKTDYLLESIELNLNKYIVKPLTSKKLYELLDNLNKTFLSQNKITILNKIYDKKEFTKKELDFLNILLKNSFISYDNIDELWIDPPTQNALRLFIKHLRQKVPEDMILNKSGLGYFLNEKKT